MNIVIIGGGAAGMATAHYLAKSHQVFLLEKQPILGGNIRTLNRNVEVDNIPPDIVLDNGVIEFHQDYSPGFRSLIDELGLELEPIAGGSTGLYLVDGRCIHMPGVIRKQSSSPTESFWLHFKLLWTLRRLIPIGIRMYRSHYKPNDRVGSFLGTDVMSKWIRMLLMYGYSIPYGLIDDFPARLAIPTLKQGFIGTKWVRLKGGVYGYIEEIISQADSNLSIELDQSITGVKRQRKGVSVECTAGRLEADRVVFAVPPDQVLKLLGDPDDDELRQFGPWQANYATTVIHTDSSIYPESDTPRFTEFDVFEKEGEDAGYNAYLNRLCGMPDDCDTDYFLAYNMEDRIDPRTILHKQRHHTPFYSAESDELTDEIRSGNGSNHTYHSGAYLYSGLHEGAIQSALAVKSLFNL